MNDHSQYMNNMKIKHTHTWQWTMETDWKCIDHVKYRIPQRDPIPLSVQYCSDLPDSNHAPITKFICHCGVFKWVQEKEIKSQ